VVTDGTNRIGDLDNPARVELEGGDVGTVGSDLYPLAGRDACGTMAPATPVPGTGLIL